MIPAFVAALAAFPALADEIYRWVDEDGQVHYSDVPRDGAEQVELEPGSDILRSGGQRSAAAAGSRTDATGSPVMPG